MKVFDFAKKLNLETMVLMKKIHQWKLPVKSHMVNLSDDLMQKIQERLDEENSSSRTKKTKVKKKVKKTSSKTTKTTKTSSAKKSTTKTVKPRKKIIKKTKSGELSSKKSSVKTEKDLDQKNLKVEASKEPTRVRNIRTGFVAVKTFEDFADKEVKKEEVKKEIPKKRLGKDLNVKSFSSSDFRKREIVFQPKKKTVSSGLSKKVNITLPKDHKRIVKIHGEISLENLAYQMKVKKKVLIRKLKDNGVQTSKDMNLDFDTASLIATEFKWEVKNLKKDTKDLLTGLSFGNLDKKKVPRPPVVTVMGHVDHGKTSLLDAIRKTDVALKEKGGITQHIGAYQVLLENKKRITFIDTPGHHSFTEMRQRGAKATDIVIIVVAADDGVMPQTVEAISHAKAAKVPIIVAVNKIDRPQVQVEKIKQQLAEHELAPEEWGGETIYVEVSALKKKGIKELLEQVLLVAEVLDLKENPDRSAECVVLESFLEKGRGPVLNVLVQKGSLKNKDIFFVADQFGQVRSLSDDKKQKIKEALPSQPVELIGSSGVVPAGSLVYVCQKESDARKMAERFKADQMKNKSNQKTSADDLLKSLTEKDKKEFSVILKADVDGVLKAIVSELNEFKDKKDQVKMKVVHQALGEISESDVLLASTVEEGMVVGFNVRPSVKAQSLAKEKSVKIKTYGIIYELIEDLKKWVSHLVEKEMVEEVLGLAEIREVFQVSKVGKIAGCMVLNGLIRKEKVRVIRDGKVLYTSNLKSLKRFKDDAKEVKQGFECGMSVENYNDLKVGDHLEVFSEVEKKDD